MSAVVSCGAVPAGMLSQHAWKRLRMTCKECTGSLWKRRVEGSSYIYHPHSRWVEHYLCLHPLFPPRVFRENFRVPRTMFTRDMTDQPSHSPQTWSEQRDAVGRAGVASEVKVPVCLRRMRCASSLRDLDDSAQMGNQTIRKYMKLLIRHVKEIYGASYLPSSDSSGARGFVQ